MADFDLIQTDAQVQSILNDGQNMQGAGAQTTLTTESVLLKDVNGNYHKILKSSFTEAIRDTLAGLLVNNDKGTTINQIAAIANGDFGSITPANLASVLGGQLGQTSIILGNGETHTITGLSDVTILVIKKADTDDICLVLKSWSHCVVLGDTDLYVTSDVEGKICVTASNYDVLIKNNMGGTKNFIYSIVKRVS